MTKPILTLLLLLSACTPSQCQTEWRKIDATEYALWRDGVQIGNYRLGDEAYYPRLGPGSWGDPCECPVSLAPEIETAVAEHRKAHWQTNGAAFGTVRRRKSGGGLRFHNLPPKMRAAACAGDPKPDIEKIPDYSTMPSLTLVARNEADARAALEMFESSPELAFWRDKYSRRAKAYGAKEFETIGRAFKLDRDRQFQETGLVALVQPNAPGEEGKAEVKSYYAWATPQDALKALRDADPHYDPNPPATPQPEASELPGLWGKIACSAGLGGGSLVMLFGAIAAALKAILS